jgi:dCMP deaminase
MNWLKKIKTSSGKKYQILLKECYHYASKSNHPSTHNSALLVKDEKVILVGKNIFPKGVKYTEKRVNKNNKHIYPNHAERDLIYHAAKKGIKTEGLTIVMPWLPCIQCANAIISSGIKKLIVHKQMIERTRTGWQKELENALEIMFEAGIKIIAFDGIVGAKAYMHGQEWDA